MKRFLDRHIEYMAFLPLLVFPLALAIAACTSLGAPANLATDCAAQAGLIQQATANVTKLVTAERNAIDAQIALSKGYCSGTLPADQTAASKAVQASNAHIAAVFGVAALRK